MEHGAMAEIQQMHGHPTATIPFGVDDLVFAVAEAATHHDHRHIFGNVFQCGDAGPVVLVDDHARRPDRQTHAHTSLDGVHVGLIQRNDIEQEPTFTGGGLDPMVRFGRGEGGRIGREHHHGVHLPVRQSARHNARLVAQLLDGLGDAFTLVFGDVDGAVEIPGDGRCRDSGQFGHVLDHRPGAARTSRHPCLPCCCQLLLLRTSRRTGITMAVIQSHPYPFSRAPTSVPRFSPRFIVVHDGGTYTQIDNFAKTVR